MKRLGPEQAEKIMNKPVCLQVLQKIRMLQSACGRLDKPGKKFPIPFDSFLTGTTDLNMKILRSHFGDNFIDRHICKERESVKREGGEGNGDGDKLAGRYHTQK